MAKRWVNLSVWGAVLFCFSVGMNAGCAVFHATGRSVEAVGEGVGHAVAGTGRAVARAASETKHDLTGR